MNDSVREAFEALEQAKNKFEMCGAIFEFDTIKAALSANGGEEAPVGYTGSGSLDAMKQGAEGHIFPSPAPSHTIPLYLGPTVKESLTVQSEPIGYADPDTLADYRAGDRLHMPVYRPDASEEWQSGIPVYLHPAPPSVAVPEGWMLFPVEAWRFLTGEAALAGVHFGETVSDDKTGRAKPFWWRSHIRHMLTAAPSGDAKREAEIKAEALEEFADGLIPGDLLQALPVIREKLEFAARATRGRAARLRQSSDGDDSEGVE